MDDSSFCQQKPYSCTAAYYLVLHFLPHCLVGGVNSVPIVPGSNLPVVYM